MTSTLSSLPSSEDASRHSQALKPLVEIIFAGGNEHPEQSGRLSQGMAIDPTGWLSQWRPLPSATAHAILRRGVPSRALPLLGEYLGIGKGVLADIVGIDRATASRKVASDQPLPLHAAERVLRLLELQCQAEDTFESPAAASAWLRRGHDMLEGDTPLEWVTSSYGTQRVKELLVALKYGGVV